MVPEKLIMLIGLAGLVFVTIYVIRYMRDEL